MQKTVIFKIVNMFVGLLVFSNLTAQINYTTNDSLIFNEYIAKFSVYNNIPENELLVLTAKHFLDKPYVASTLDKTDTEQLAINLREFDCTTFVESCWALTQTIKSKDYSFHNFFHILLNIRYRNGKIKDYTSRLHYVSDWISEHESHKRLNNISKKLKGSLCTNTINFMSEHVSSYPQLKKSEKLWQEIKKVEASLNKAGGYYVISKGKIRNIEKYLKNGDIVAFATNITGLDFSHIGIVYINNEQVSFIHASSSAKKVVIERRTLNDYCLTSKRCNGITILRLTSDNYE